jgi:hypothetical protein
VGASIAERRTRWTRDPEAAGEDETNVRKCPVCGAVVNLRDDELELITKDSQVEGVVLNCQECNAELKTARVRSVEAGLGTPQQSFTVTRFERTPRILDLT